MCVPARPPVDLPARLPYYMYIARLYAFHPLGKMRLPFLLMSKWTGF